MERQLNAVDAEPPSLEIVTSIAVAHAAMLLWLMQPDCMLRRQRWHYRWRRFKAHLSTLTMSTLVQLQGRALPGPPWTPAVWLEAGPAAAQGSAGWSARQTPSVPAVLQPPQVLLLVG